MPTPGIFHPRVLLNRIANDPWAESCKHVVRAARFLALGYHNSNGGTAISNRAVSVRQMRTDYPPACRFLLFVEEAGDHVVDSAYHQYVVDVWARWTREASKLSKSRNLDCAL